MIDRFIDKLLTEVSFLRVVYPLVKSECSRNHDIDPTCSVTMSPCVGESYLYIV